MQTSRSDAVCRHGEIAEVRIRGRRTKLLDGFAIDDGTQYRIRRTQDIYVLDLGWSGQVSDNPWNNIYSIEIQVSTAGYRVRRLSSVGDARCENTLVPYSSAVDLVAGRITYEFGDERSAPKAERVFSYPLPGGAVAEALDVSYEDQLLVLAAAPSPDEQAICVANGRPAPGS